MDRYLDSDPEDAPVNMGYSLFDITKSVTLLFIVQSLLDDPETTIHRKSGLKLSRSQFRSSVYVWKNFSIQFAT